ncbi:T6SS amidase immunity protein Tai4 family protein [Bordetella genomosp. 13]|uniref:Type VI secretion protein n=1 Tax=Bordetella genomosp. 13 TaxID=463040 RepID=A0A1W6ZCI5_9BORD|nr:T6SS amidase immunity protein Tai4 family protein [Bordetella genomosp. 13]ARP95108.1 hypothetical protein CAL15_12415 [Bordetella genomosp. 13]
MSARWMAAALLAWPLAACAATSGQAGGQARGAQTEAQRLEKFAVSQCLMRAFPDTPVAADARRASGGYVELGSAPEDVYGQIVEVVQAYRAKPYRSKSGESLHVMQCLDLLNDPALQTLVEPYR